MEKKMISVCIPCYNEEGNVELMYQTIAKQFEQIPQYDFELIFEDNCSQDGTQKLLREIASQDNRVKIILNERNVGPMKNSAHIVFQATGDAIIGLPCDFQEPPELIPDLVRGWERGYKVVMGQKNESEENIIMYKIRTLYYKIINWLSDVPQFEQTTGFGIFDREVIDMIYSLNEPQPNFRNIVAELGYQTLLIPYRQRKRKKGKSGYGFWKYINLAIESLICTSKVPLRIATFLGFWCSGISFLAGLVYLVYKLIYWENFTVGTAPVVIGLFFLGSVQLLFIGIIGEYIGAILTRITKRPLVVEKERINF